MNEPCPCPSANPIPTILVVPIDIEECWAVDHHWYGSTRTPMGELVHAAKTYGTKLGERRAANRLGECLAYWASRLVEYAPLRHVSQLAEADLVCPVPDNPSKQPYNLPDVLARVVADRLARPYVHRLVRKVRPTSEVKFTTDKVAKLRELAGAFEVTADVRGKVVLVVDDLVLSGATLESIGEVLRGAGARRIIGLAATKATKGLVLTP